MPSYVLTFKDYTPSPRDDTIPWTQAQILEAASQDGTYTLIDTVVLNPVDTDPATPQAREFTTNKATLPAGWYQVVFVDDSNGQSPAQPVFNNNTLSSYLPSVTDVAALLRARTRDSNGNEAGTFTASTRPTQSQVEQLIDQSAQRTLNKLGPNPPFEVWEQVSNVIALSTALRVELSFFPDQITAGRSAYTELKALRDEELADLIVALEAFGAADGEEDPDVASGLAVFVQPPTPLDRAAGAETDWPTTRWGW